MQEYGFNIVGDMKKYLTMSYILIATSLATSILLSPLQKNLVTRVQDSCIIWFEAPIQGTKRDHIRF